MKIDVFMSVNRPLTKEREYTHHLSQIALHLQGFETKVIEQPPFQRYIWAEKHAQSDIYVICDNNILPATQTTLKELVELFKTHPEYSLIGLRWDIELYSVTPWQNMSYPSTDGEVINTTHCDKCVAVRKGILKDFEYLEDEWNSGYEDSQIVGINARKMGYKVGVAANLYYHDLNGA